MSAASVIRDISERSQEIAKSQHELKNEILMTGTLLAESVDAMDISNRRPAQMQSEQIPEANPVSAEFSVQLEKLLQGSMEGLEERLSQKMLSLLEDLRNAAGLAREIKIREIREAVTSESIDLSKLFSHDRIESNIEVIGVEENDSEGLDESLKKLRSIRDGN